MTLGSLHDLQLARYAIAAITSQGVPAMYLSLIMESPTQARQLGYGYGPIHALNPSLLYPILNQAGVAHGTIDQYQSTITHGGALIAVTGPDYYQNVAQHVLNNFQATSVTYAHDPAAIQA